MENELLNELIATSKDQLRLLQIIANRLVDGKPDFDEKPEPVADKSTEMSDEEKAKWSLAGKKAWATRRANKVKAAAEASTTAEATADSENESQNADDTGISGTESSKQESLFGTKEWAVCTMNCYKGCDNACAYCYAQADFSRYDKEFVKIKDVPVARDWDKVVKDFKAKCRKLKGAGRVMFPSVHDITPMTLVYCLRVLKFMMEFEGNSIEFLIVSKPHLRCIKSLCEDLAEYKDRILFRFTIGSADDAVLKFWEPGASSFGERIECLKYAYEHGFKTSVSCEPMLDDNIDAVIKGAYDYVTDAIWLGSGNKMAYRVKSNGCLDEIHMEKLKEHAEFSTEEKAKELYARWGSDSKIKWKETLKKVLGLPLSDKAGADV